MPVNYQLMLSAKLSACPLFVRFYSFFLTFYFLYNVLSLGTQLFSCVLFFRMLLVAVKFFRARTKFTKTAQLQ